MQVTIIFCNKNHKNNKLFIINNGFLNNNKFFVNFSKSYSNFLGDYYSNDNIKIANTNDTQILYIFSAFGSNDLSDFSIIN